MNKIIENPEIMTSLAERRDAFRWSLKTFDPALERQGSSLFQRRVVRLQRTSAGEAGCIHIFVLDNVSPVVFLKNTAILYEDRYLKSLTNLHIRMVLARTLPYARVRPCTQPVRT